MTSLSEVYIARFQEREQNDAHDVNRKTRFDGFGEPIDSPTVEGFDGYGPNPYLIQRKARILAQARNEAQSLAERQTRILAGRDARRRINALMGVRRPK